MTEDWETGDPNGASWLASVPMLEGVSEDTLRHLEAIATPVETTPGQVLTQAGAPGAGLFVVQEGTVEVERPGQSSIELGPGQAFGELALLTDAASAARASARRRPGAAGRSRGRTSSTSSTASRRWRCTCSPCSRSGWPTRSPSQSSGCLMRSSPVAGVHRIARRSGANWMKPARSTSTANRW